MIRIKNRATVNLVIDIIELAVDSIAHTLNTFRLKILSSNGNSNKNRFFSLLPFLFMFICVYILSFMCRFTIFFLKSKQMGCDNKTEENAQREKYEENVKKSRTFNGCIFVWSIIELLAFAF